MANASEFSVGLMHEVVVAGCEVGWEPKDFDALKRDKPLLTNVLSVMRGTHTIQAVEHAVDPFAAPFVPDGWKIEEHQQGSVLQLEKKLDGLYANGKKLTLYLSKKQKKGNIVGTALRTELKGKAVLNANVLDYLLAHPQLIPEEWKKDEKDDTRYLFFWGTLYRSSYGYLCVRYLYWDGDRWGWGSNWLDSGWRASHPAVLLAS